MLFIRQRVLLTMLDALEHRVSNTDFQKLLFLYTMDCEETPSYEFVPYRFGAFSFTSYADKRRLTTAGLLTEDDKHWSLTESGREAARHQSVDKKRIAKFCTEKAGLRGDELITVVYRRFPYFATRSEIFDRLLPDPSERAIMEDAKPKNHEHRLLTIGYEGKTLERYLNELIRASVTLLCDVRRNPISRKYGFSKSTLCKACESVGIRYEHLPELGIESSNRQNLVTQADYDALFDQYEKYHLPNQSAAILKIRNWIEQDGYRLALTCYEAKPSMCHRRCVASALERLDVSSLAAHHL